MKDRQKIFLDKVVKLLVGDTRIDYDKEKISYPFLPHTRLFRSLHSPLFLSFPSLIFSTYSKNQFGLTDEEIDYVWVQYRSIIKDKISKREP